MKVNVINLQRELSLDKSTLKNMVKKIFRWEGKGISGNINLVFVDDRLIRKLNRYFLKEDRATDVLSFEESKDGKRFFGEVIISTDRAKVNAKRYKTTARYEVFLYVVHGVLHLLGYSDKTTKEKKRMYRRTQEILSRLNINF